MTIYSLMVILGCGLVTFLTRVVPFAFIKKVKLPNVAIRFLSYVPICILTALFVQNLFLQKENGFPDLNVEYALATIPTALVAILTKNLMWVVVAGMSFIAMIRYFLPAIYG